MRRQIRCGWLTLGVSALLLPGCMHTRYAESSNFWNVGGGCPCGSEHHSTHKERHWSGFWFGQPDEVRP